MTFTAVALDRRTGELGIAIATYSLAVGASSPFLRAGVGAVTTQAATWSPHGPALLDALEAGTPPEEALAGLPAADRHVERRQVGVVTAAGEVAARTGAQTRAWAGEVAGDGWLALGNVLAGEHVVAAMGAALQDAVGMPLAERLVRALEAGCDAGGQVGLDGARLQERSAVVSVVRDQPFPSLDLRVDAHDDAVTALRALLDRWSAVEPYYRLRAERPDEAPPQDAWMRDRGLG